MTAAKPMAKPFGCLGKQEAEAVGYTNILSLDDSSNLSSSFDQWLG